jgi:probable rRNA maturation factor
MEIIINNSSGVRIDRSMIRRLAGRISRKRWKVSISFVKKGAMKKLNNKYRKMNRPTDVLSFTMKEGRLLGDVVICPAIAKTNAARYGGTFKSEIARLVTHGILHLLGYGHGRKMFDKQDKILEGMNYA